jgi:hypothetical protein
MEEQEGEASPVWGLVPMRKEGVRKGEGGRMWWNYYIFMYENGTMRSGDTVIRKGRVGIKENDGGGEFKTHCKYFCNCPSVLPVQL